MGENSVNLPPGFRFYPTDEELVVHFLHRKAALLPCHPDVIPDLDLYPYDPWDLEGMQLLFSPPFSRFSFAFFVWKIHNYYIRIYVRFWMTRNWPLLSEFLFSFYFVFVYDSFQGERWGKGINGISIAGGRRAG